MNRVGVLFLLFAIWGCREKSPTKAASLEVIHTEFVDLSDTNSLDTLWISPESRVYWKGTKMRGLGKHEGKVSLKMGFLLVNREQWVGGYFEIDMEKIRVTDIPETDPIPLKELTEHLKNGDFFDVGRFPVSRFTLQKIDDTDQHKLILTGQLEIKGISKPISFEGRRNGKEISAEFSIDRFDWNIAYTASWADRTLVDREIEFRVKLVMEE
jgi:polyisoprenoid-binding protein YceI